MSKRQILMVIGIAVMAFLFIGFPLALDKALSLIFGLIILIIAISLKSSPKKAFNGSVSYVEHKNNYPVKNEIDNSQNKYNQSETTLDQNQTIINPDSNMNT